LKEEWPPGHKTVYLWVLWLTILTGILVAGLWVYLLLPTNGAQSLFKQNTATYLVAGDSMTPTLADKQRITLTHPKEQTTPRSRDIIVFTAPKTWTTTGAEPTLIKRVNGTSGDTITVKNQQLHINNTSIDLTTVKGCQLTNGYTTTIPENMVFVTGDNHGHSTDSLTQLCKHPTKPDDAFIPTNTVKDYGVTTNA
jgi:signal peptidase I